MKKWTLFIVFCLSNFIVISVFGQITITDSSAPNAAEDIIYTISNRTIDTTITGQNTTWDFSKVQATAQDTYKFLAPKDISAAYATPFNGDLGLDLKNPNVNGSFAFFNTSSSDFRQAGLGITVPVINLATPLPYKSPDIVYRFPMEYGNIDSCHYGGRINILGTNASITGTRVDTVDGWGTVITPYKTYKCLRVKSVVTETDTIGSNVIFNHVVQYKWISANEHIPVFEDDMIPNGMGGNSETLKWRDSYKNIEDPDGPYVDFSANDTNVFVKDTVRFQDKSVAKLSSWLWTVIPATYSFIEGTKNTSQNPVVVFNSEGAYTISLKGIDSGGGGNTKVRLNYINVTHNSGILNQVGSVQQLELYPNPSNGSISIRPDKSLTGKQCDIIVYNSTGKEVYNHAFICNGDALIMNSCDYGKGLYIVKLESENQIFSNKVVLY